MGDAARRGQETKGAKTGCISGGRSPSCADQPPGSPALRRNTHDPYL